MIEKVIDISKDAGKILLKYFDSDYNIKYKGENDPVTEADYEADEFIRKRLSEEFPGDQILSEETEDNVKNYSGRVWIVDPLDGTLVFTEKGEEFCILIGLCEDGIPTLGVIYAPARNELYYAVKGKGAFYLNGNIKKEIKVSPVSDILESKSVIKVYKKYEKLNDIKTKENFLLREYSAGLRIMQIATGEKDFYIEGSLRPSKWDTCASQIILEEAGGKMTDIEGNSLDYKQKESRWKIPFLASNKTIHEKVVEEIKKISI